MKKYVVVDWKKHEEFEDVFDSEQEAITAADSLWEHLTADDRSEREFFEVLYGEVDGDGILDLDSAVVVKKYK